MRLTVDDAMKRLEDLVEKGWGELRIVVKNHEIAVIAKTETEISQGTS